MEIKQHKHNRMLIHEGVNRFLLAYTPDYQLTPPNTRESRHTSTSGTGFRSSSVLCNLIAHAICYNGHNKPCYVIQQPMPFVIMGTTNHAM